MVFNYLSLNLFHYFTVYTMLNFNIFIMFIMFIYIYLMFYILGIIYDKKKNNGHFYYICNV